ncbi:MAG: dUTP diphosphatase [Erysipelotrichaceae bacterium]
MKLKIEDLYSIQKELDDRIAKIHNVSYEETKTKRILALLVEIGELANETRCFKYWSNKASSPKEVVLEEYVDGIHFLLSLGLYFNEQPKIIESLNNKLSLSEAFVEVYGLIAKLHLDFNEAGYIEAFRMFIAIGDMLMFSVEDIRSSYLMKNEENHSRQDNDY